MTKRRVGILISGSGSNMAALVAAMADAAFPAMPVLVLSNRPEAGGLAKAAAAGVPTAVVNHRAFADRQGFEIAMQAELDRHEVDFVCLAGFMRLLTPWFIDRWHDQMLNIHPALLPAYKGLHTHARALADGVKLAGATVHFVRPEMDVGPIVMQGAVPVLTGDTPDTLAARVLTVEHRIYPAALRLVASDRARIMRQDETETVAITGEPAGTDMLVAPATAG